MDFGGNPWWLGPVDAKVWNGRSRECRCPQYQRCRCEDARGVLSNSGTVSLQSSTPLLMEDLSNFGALVGLGPMTIEPVE